MANTKLIFIFGYLQYASSFEHENLSRVNVTGTNVTAHLQVAHIQRICNSTDIICKSNNTMVCTVRKVKDEYEHKTYENSCFLFLSNMCDNPGKEFSIASSGDCADYLKTRRMYVYSGVGVSPPTTQQTTLNENNTLNATAPVLRDGAFSTLYEVEFASDYHICPLRCPDVYNPVCVNINRDNGKFFKLLTFVNHCYSDLYYCKHWREFSPPEEGDLEDVTTSFLPWSYCGAHRYLQFARFAEVTSAMGHYGWLQGDHRYSHIVAPHERKPGYG